MSISVKREKSEFISYNNQKISDNQWMLNFVNNEIRSVIEMFSGKVANVKIEREIQSRLTNEDKERTYVACNLGYSYNYSEHKNVSTYHVKIKRRYDKWNYNDGVEVELSFVLDYDLVINKSPRLNAEKALAECDNAVKYLTEIIKSYTDSVVNYDKYMDKAKELDRLISEFNNINYNFRANIDQYSLHIYHG